MPTLIEKFELDQKRRGLSPNTIMLRNRQLNSYVKEVGPLEHADEDKIEVWLDERVKPNGEPISEKTRSGYLTTLSAFFKFAKKKKHLTYNPVDDIERPKVHNGLPNPIPEEALARAIDGVEKSRSRDKPKLKCWIILEAYGGMRCQEVAFLDDTDVKADIGQVLIRFGKGGKQRSVPLHPKMAAALAEYCEGKEPIKGRLWPTATPSTVSQQINRYYHGMGITHTAHKNRHRAGSQVHELSGGSLLVVQNFLGHSDPKTSAIYAKLNDELVSSAVLAMA